MLSGFNCYSQIDPEHRNLLELGYDQPLAGQLVMGTTFVFTQMPFVVVTIGIMWSGCTG